MSLSELLELGVIRLAQTPCRIFLGITPYLAVNNCMTDCNLGAKI